MDFHLDEELVALRDLAAEITGDLATTDRVRQVEEGDTRVDDRLWSALADAGLLGVGVAEEHGGAGLADRAVHGCCVVLTEQGRRVAPVPLWPHLVGTLAVGAHGTPTQRDALLPGGTDGSLRLTLALEELDGRDPRSPECRAERTPAGPDGPGWTLHGTKAAVPTPDGAAQVLVSATGPDGPGLFLVPTAELTWENAETTSRDRAGHLTLDGTPAAPLGDAPTPTALAAVLRWSTLALAALQVGVAAGAMRLAAGYTSEREQFGRPLGSFQAVQHQLADCWIDVDAMQLTLWQALQSEQQAQADRGDGADAPAVAGDDAEAARAALVAKWWCDQAGLDVVHRTQHVHGGIGVDVDYPVHRHFLWGKQLAGTLGGAEDALAGLGDLLATGTGAAAVAPETPGDPTRTEAVS